MTRARNLADQHKTLDVDGGTIKLDGNYPTGTGNVALGDAALDDGSLSGGSNTAIGSGALTANTTANNNTALGSSALYSNTTASENTAVGYQALYANTTGAQSTAIGSYALDSVTTGNENTAVGYQAGNTATTAAANSLFGRLAGRDTTGSYNTFLGHNSGYQITTGSKNTVIGRYDGNQGGLDIRTSNNYIVLSDGDGNPRIIVDNSGFLKCAGVYNQSAADSANVVVDSVGNIYRSTSALKYKQDIRDIEEIDISQFRPIRYKSNLNRDDQTKDHFGFIADEAHDAGYTELVSYGAVNEETGIAEVEGFRYDRMTVLLTKVVQQQQETITALEARIAALES